MIGQEHITQTLQNALKMGNAAHAYLFTGPRGTGKTTMARVLTKALNCAEFSGADACAKCEACKEIENGSFVDLIEIDAASNRGIDEIRELKEGVRFTPSKGARKVYLIDEVHMLTKEASNALLKTLEEPPEHTVFILATTEPHKVLPTIISRTQRFDFRYLTHKEIKKRIADIARREKKQLSDEAVQLIVAAAGGSLRDAESILGKALSFDNPTAEQLRDLLGVVDTDRVIAFISALGAKEKDPALQELNGLREQGSDLEQFAASVVEYGRILLYNKLSPSSADLIGTDLTQEQQQQTRKLAEQLTDKQVYGIIREFMEAKGAIKHAPIAQLPLELAVLNLLEN